MNNFKRNKNALRNLVCPFVLATAMATSTIGLVGCGESNSNSEEQIPKYMEEDRKSTYIIYELNDNTAIIFDGGIIGSSSGLIALKYYDKNELITAISVGNDDVVLFYNHTYEETVALAEDMLGKDAVVMHASEYFEQLEKRTENSKNIKEKQKIKN